MTPCRICNNIDRNSVILAREMMYGTREEFGYFECAQCGCVQIDAIPQNLSSFYPTDYYSLSLGNEPAIKRYIRRLRDAQLLGRASLLGSLATRIHGQPEYGPWLANRGLPSDAKILDVGAGAGSLVFHIAEAGFSQVSGIEPNIESDIQLSNGATILKSTLAKTIGLYDLVMLHHSFEHMPDPLEQLIHVRRILEPNGIVIIRIPIVGTYAWNTYGPNWVQLDAPRHLTLHTKESLAILADQAGLVVTSIEFDSTEFQFWGSDLYSCNIALVEAMDLNQPKAPVGASKLRQMRTQAEHLNSIGQGDQAALTFALVIPRPNNDRPLRTSNT